LWLLLTTFRNHTFIFPFDQQVNENIKIQHVNPNKFVIIACKWEKIMDTNNSLENS
jgi:hypothetical protein